MNPNGTPGSEPPASAEGGATTSALLKSLVIWGVFLGLAYLARNFFFIAFMTFLISYLTLGIVDRALKWFAAGRDRPGLRRLLTIGVFVLTPLVLSGIGALVGPSLLAQGQRLAGYFSHANPETEVSRIFEDFVGPSEFRGRYGGPSDPRYREGLEEFRKSGQLHVAAYNQFPAQEAWIEGGFSKQFAEDERVRIHLKLRNAGSSSKEFEEWFLKEKVPALQEQARKHVAAEGRSSTPIDPLARAAASAKPEQLLIEVRRDPAALATLREEWTNEALEQGIAAAKRSPAYQDRFKEYYDKQRATAPGTMPYTYDEYIQLQKVRPQGPLAFGKALEAMRPTAAGDNEARVRRDFEDSKQHELFAEWWSTNSIARFVRKRIETNASGAGDNRVDKILGQVINIPLDLATALLLSFFICIDFPRLKSGVQALRDTWLREAYDQIAPALTSLSNLVGLSMHAQGLIALCNAVMMFIALTIIGVEHAVLLGFATFILCLVPTLGSMLAWCLIAVCALLQPGGGLVLALKATGAVLFVMAMELFVFSPRILGKMMELHPVVMMALLPIAQSFFGIWGLILATPVAVYVIYAIILRRDLPGTEAKTGTAAVEAATPPPGGHAKAEQGLLVAETAKAT